MTPELALCFAENAKYLVLASHVPKLIYYTHLTALVLSLLVGLFVYLNDRKSLTNKILFWSLVPFLIWVFFNVIIWASNQSDLIMFLWSIQIMIEPLTYIGMFYLVYVFINKHDAQLKAKIFSPLIESSRGPCKRVQESTNAVFPSAASTVGWEVRVMGESSVSATCVKSIFSK